MRRIIFACCSIVLCLGCGREPYKVAQVAGKVTLNGKPLANANVNFAPLGTGDNVNPGPTSQAVTDAQGRFTLHLDIPEKPAGAVVGTNRVYITTGGSHWTGPAGEQPDAGVKRKKELVPARYNASTELTFLVPAAGTDQANFELINQ